MTLEDLKADKEVLQGRINKLVREFCEKYPSVTVGLESKNIYLDNGARTATQITLKTTLTI